jgi:outer membrane protein assembly factor BamA
MRRCLTVLAIATALLGQGVIARAQELDQPARRSPLDVGDLWRMVRHLPTDTTPAQKRSLVAAPSIGSKPSTGLSVGFSSSLAFFAGEPAHTHISSILAGIKVTQNKQVNLGSRLNVFTSEDRWFLQFDNRMAWTSQNTYAFGTDATPGSATNAKFNSLKLYENVFRQVRPGLFVGGGLNVSDHGDIRAGKISPTPWDNSAFINYSHATGLSEEHQRSAGTSIGLRLDTRDNGINPDRGWLAAGTYRAFFNGFLGGDTSWDEAAVDLRTYKSLTHDARQKLAFWFLGDFVTRGIAPFFDLPATGGDGRSARGYTDGRYRGDRLLYAETEYRGTLTSNGLLGFVLFANATTIGDSISGTSLFDSVAPAGGLGLRVLLNKRSKTNLCTDYGWGKSGSHGFYLSIQEAF